MLKALSETGLLKPQNEKLYISIVKTAKRINFHPCRAGQDSHLVHVHHQRCPASHGETIQSWSGFVVLRHGEIFDVQVVNASVNLPIFFFAGKSFREVTINLVRWARLQKEFEQNNLLVFYVAFNTLIIRYTSYFLIFRCC